MLSVTIKSSVRIFIILLPILAVMVNSFKVQSQETNLVDQPISANVMGPLWLETPLQWQAFKDDLDSVKEIGVRAVTIDVWWGKVEAKQDQDFQWHYYDKVFAEITKRGLRLIPIMSFHQCGGNVGDTCNIPLPKWLWEHSPDFTAQQLKYKSEQGNYSDEFLSLWANEFALQQYVEFMQAFEQQYMHLSDKIDELNVSMGPAGELRFPSYNQHDVGTGYPTRGAWQVYGELPKNDFIKQLKKKYSNIETLNAHWNTKYKNFNQLSIATPENCQGKQCEDTINWFHQALVEHGKQMLYATDRGFSKSFKQISLGYKIPGIHWMMAKQGKWHRAAEIATGLIPAKVNKDSGYSDVIQLANIKLSNPRSIIIHFTALEMSNTPKAPAYSLANDLVVNFAEEAKRYGVSVKGENALAAGVTNEYGWNNIHNHFEQGRFDGITVLRLTNVGSGFGKQAFKKFISTYAK